MLDFSYLQDLLDSAIAAARVDRGGAIHVLVDSQQKLYLAAHTGFAPAFLSAFPPTDPVDRSTAIGRAATTRQRVVIQDTEREEGYGPRDHARSAGYRSAHAVPLISRKGKVLGVLILLYQKPHYPSTFELRTVDTYARMAATVIEAGRLQASITSAERDGAHPSSAIELRAAIRRLRANPYNSVLVQEICKLGDNYVDKMWAAVERVGAYAAGP